MSNFSVDRGSTKDQERWLAELAAAAEAENFPPGGSLILAESPPHALQIVNELRAKGHRALVRGVYVRTSARSPSHKGPRK
jgi:hypothetical protein